MNPLLRKSFYTILLCFFCFINVILNTKLLYLYIPLTLFCIVTNPTTSLLNIIPFYVFLLICFTLILMKSSKKFFEKNSYSLHNIGTGITLDPFKKFMNTLFSLLFLGYPFNLRKDLEILKMTKGFQIKVREKTMVIK